MLLYILDWTAPSLKILFLGDIFSAIAYGIVIVLSVTCFHLLQKKRSTYSNRMRIILLIYITVMVLLSTLTLLQSICSFMAYLTPQNILPGWNLSDDYSVTIPFVVWGADGLMVRISILCQEQRFTMQLQIWHCLILYQGISRGPRVMIIVLLSLISFASFGRSISIYTPEYHSNCSWKHKVPVSWGCYSNTTRFPPASC